MNNFNRFYFDERKKLPYIFGYAKQIVWNKDQLEKLSQNYGSSFEEVDEALKIFAEEDLQIDSYLQYKTCYPCFLAFFTQEEKTEEEKENAYLYYKKYALSFEKKKFENFVKDILAKYKKKIITNENASGYLKEWSINLYDLYQLIHIMPELSLYQNFLIDQAKVYYELCASVHFDLEEIQKLALNEVLNSEQILTLANLYARNILHFDILNQTHLYKRNVYSSPVYKILDELIEEEDDSKIEQAFLEANISHLDVTIFCYGYHWEMEEEKRKTVEKKFLRHLKKLHQKKMDVIAKMHQLNLVPYEPYFQEYVNSSLSLEEFLKQKNLIKSTFLARLRKSSDMDLVLKVREKVNQEKIKSLDYIIETCKEIASYLIQGYPNGDTVKKFTLFDYFILYPELNLQDVNLNKLALTSEEKKVLNKFLNPLRANVTMPKEKVLQLKLEFHSKKDKDGFPIKGTGIIINEEELELIADYLTSHNIPLVNSIVNIAAREYVDGNLVIDTLQKR